ncbi:MAG: ThuA domain-containing protein [Cyclobacteriaceae bacterium]|nr:ThuA domain-containing protein [Cyclobacteriaceae bacterium]
MRILPYFLALCIFLQSCGTRQHSKPRVLVFSRPAAFVHQSIPAGLAAIQKLGAEHGFQVDTTKDASLFTETNLANYSAVLFLSTTGDVLDHRQEAAFERYIQAGGGFVGVHAASDTEYDWGWYGRLVGAYFDSHPAPQEARFVIRNQNHPSTSFFTDSSWQRKDEHYNFKKMADDLQVLITIDERSYRGGTNGDVHPMSWYHEYDGGRSFYTAMGHEVEVYQDEQFLKHLLGGIQYAMGENKPLDYSKARSQFPPDDDLFVKTQLASGGLFVEPMEMTVLPNLDVLIVQRRGQILLYKSETGKVKPVGFLKVYHKARAKGVNAEEGLLGVAKDPQFEKNHWVYLYYSHATEAANRLSRFTLENDTILLSTEKVILDVKSQREICCHTGGSIAFGPDGLLYLSTGDNATPFDEPGQKYVNRGFGPLNDTPGHEQYDARRSSGNTNDLRGKILRIRINPDGTYSIPEGNLFPPGTPKARPEIYAMGLRNPFRISVDQKNGYLYWGEVGPDASADSLETRGPRGYDELNQARRAGFFGWPLFVGNNYPYHRYNYVTGQSGEPFDPLHPVNESRNNTGLRDLPPVSPAFIWYPYGPSPDFPQVGNGGRTAMAGPVYYNDLYPEATRLPDYYNGKLFFYEWMRGWTKVVTLLPNGDFDKMEPFAPTIKTNYMIDLEVGPDGRLYVLEYGTGWFTQNPDAGLARIDYKPRPQ